MRLDPSGLEPTASFPTGPDPIELAVAGVVALGWAVVDGFLPSELVRSWADQVREEIDRETFHSAIVGRGDLASHRPEIRADSIRWLDENDPASNPALYWQQMERLRSEINRAAYLGLVDLEAHLALYPPGARYHCHLDRFADDRAESVGSRTVSTILYLNQDWREDDGGTLRIYLDQPERQPWLDVLPLGGRLVCFLSGQFHHEVLPARRDRLSVTGWLRRRA